MARLRLRLPRQRGRPRTRPDVVLGDKAYPSRAIREHLRKCGIRAVVPVPAERRGHRLRRGSRGGRPPAFDREADKQRDTVERCLTRLKQWRCIATRYEKIATIYLAGRHVVGSSSGPHAAPHAAQFAPRRPPTVSGTHGCPR